MSKWLLIRNIAGYLPDDDEPNVYDSWQEALDALKEDVLVWATVQTEMAGSQIAGMEYEEDVTESVTEFYAGALTEPNTSQMLMLWQYGEGGQRQVWTIVPDEGSGEEE